MEPGGKNPLHASDKSVVDDLAYTAQNFCPMLRPLAGQRAQIVRSLITLIAFILWRWHILNNVSKNALVPLLELICQVLSVAAARKLSSVAAEAFPHTIFRLRKWLGMDHAYDFQKMVCCDKYYRIYPDDAGMRYTDHQGNLIPQKCYGEVVENGIENICNQKLFNCKKTDKRINEYTPKHIYCYQPLSKSLDNILARHGILDKCN